MRNMARTDGPDGTVSRRGLIKGAAAMGALGLMGSGLLSGCSPQAQSDKAAQTGSGIPDSWDEETDVVVVGAGGAGSMAALEVDKAGSSVILLEANSVAGGATSICGQAICAAGTKLQATLGVDDDADAFYAYLCEAGDGIVDFWRLYADNAAEIVDWLASIGVSFPEQLEVTPGLSLGGQEFLAPNQPVVPRVHWSDTEAGGIWTHLWKQVEASGVDVRMKTQATKLIFDPDTREVFGVVAGGKTIKARKGVVLAGGGIGANRELMRMYIQENKVLSQGTQFADGMTLNMAIDAGAASYGWEMAYAPGYLMGDYEEGRGQTAHAFVQMMHNSAPHPDVPYVLVDIYGKRRINETASSAWESSSDWLPKARCSTSLTRWAGAIWAGACPARWPTNRRTPSKSWPRSWGSTPKASWPRSTPGTKGRPGARIPSSGARTCSHSKAVPTSAWACTRP